MPRTLSAEQVEKFRARLCEVAQHRFATQGRDAVSMRQLADALGCSPMTPYRYFRNKDEILAAVRTAAFDRFAAALEEAAAQARGDLRGRVVVGEQELHRLKVCAGGALEAVEERHLGEEHREVGGEAGHDGFL